MTGQQAGGRHQNQHNSTSRLKIAPSVPTDNVVLYVETIVGNSFNGNQFYNPDFKATQFELYYLGTNDLTLNGTAAMAVALVAPHAHVNVQGAFDYHGAILARSLSLSGSGLVHYDESLNGVGQANDIQYRVLNFAQYYR